MVERLRVQIPSGRAEDFSSPELNLCADSYSVSVPPRDTAVARIRPRLFCQKCRWQVTPKHAYTSTQRSRNGLTKPLSRYSVGAYRAEPPWTDPGTKSGISVCELIYTSKKKKVHPGIVRSNIFSNSSQAKKKPPPLADGTRSRSLNSACRRLCCIDHLSVDLGQQQHSAALWASKQPSLGTTLLVPHGDVPRKGGLNKACHPHLVR